MTDARLAAALALYGAVLQRARYLTRAWPDAEDLTQTVFLKFFVALATLDERADTERGMKAILLRMTDNAWFDELRRRKARPFYVAPLPDDHMRHAVDDAYAECEDELVTRQWLTTLPVRQAAMLRAVYLDGWTMAEWAKENGVPLGTVKTWSRRVRFGLMEAA